MRPTEHFNLQGARAITVHALAIPITCGPGVGVGAFLSHERHDRRACDAFTPDPVDRAAILIPAATA